MAFPSGSCVEDARVKDGYDHADDVAHDRHAGADSYDDEDGDHNDDGEGGHDDDVADN